MNKNLEESLRKYAVSLLTTGLHLQEGQPLLINANVVNHDFVALVTEEAYRLGASDVVLRWSSTPCARQRALHCSEAALTQPKPWFTEFYKNYLEEDVAVLSLISADPKAMEGVPIDRLKKGTQAVQAALSFYHDAVMESNIRWCVAAVATKIWADLLDLPGTEEEQLEALWRQILCFCRIEGVPEGEELQNHLDRLSERTKALNEKHFTALHYKGDNGTDFTLKLPKKHIWQGGSESSTKGVVFTANLPTEEVFTAPQFDGVDGVVYSTKPLIYQGKEISDFMLRFEGGKVVEYSAKKGQEQLELLLDSDPRAIYLGEVALVDHYSPISASNRIFYETLFDENASCHLALGAAYPTCVESDHSLSKEELQAEGLNTSLTHVDFMIGHSGLTITGTQADGTEYPVMVKGRLVI